MKTINLKFKFLISFIAIIFLLSLAMLIFVNTTITKKLNAELIKRGIPISKDIAHGGINFVLTENIVDLQILIIGITVLILAAGITLSIFLAKKITDPLYEIIKISKAIGDGDIKQRVNIKTKDEIGELGIALNKMAENLSKTLVSKETLERSYEFTKTILNSMDELISIIDTNNFNILSANNTFLREYGFKDEKEAIGQTCYHVTHKCDHICTGEKDACPLIETLKTGNHTIKEHIHYNSNGEKRYVEVSTTPIKNDKGEINLVVHQSLDITEKKLLKQQFAQSQKLESIGTLAAGIAHEINTPIQFIWDNTRFFDDAVKSLFNLINGYSKFLSELEKNDPDNKNIIKIHILEQEIDLDYFKEELPQALNQTKEGLERVSKIVSAMKDFSHMGNEDKTKEDINKAIETTLTISRNEWKYVADAKTDLDSTLPLVNCVIGDIKQVILNLIVNAAHAIKEKNSKDNSGKGIILITSKKKDDSVVITIRDTGTGIANEIQDRVFEPFFTTKKVGIGTGQGLSIAYQIITKKHSGKLTFETEVGIGTNFIIELPIDSKNSDGDKNG